MRSRSNSLFNSSSVGREHIPFMCHDDIFIVSFHLLLKYFSNLFDHTKT